MIRRRPDIDSMAEGAVIGTVLGDVLIAALRRLAQEDASARSFLAGAQDRVARPDRSDQP
jgi:hypothetical protein